MEISQVVNTPLVFPGLVVGLVLICAVLVFVFGFKSVEDFPFDKLATVADDRKPAGKKRKLKDKKSQSNGQATVVTETKQRKSESESNKVVTGKSKQVEKSPAKDVSKASSVKPEKKTGKVEASPAKVALKETKNIKDSNKISEENQKQGKAKDVGGKQRKDQQPIKQSKGKGKENVDVKNKKNADKSKNKPEEKPKDNDDGEWEQIFSRKDKKNRKPVASDEETSDKPEKTEAASPAKKKKTKPQAVAPVPPPAVVESASAPVTPTLPASAPETPEPVKEKPAKKEKEQKKEKKQVEEPTAVENVAANVESEGEGKAAKKKKKKPAAKEGSDAVDEKTAVEEPEPAKPQPAAAEPKKAQEADSENTGAAFDELGDQWKEAKTPKKASKKKVRKAE